MAVSPANVWIAGEILTAAELNAEFSNVYNNGEDLGFPRTKVADFDGNKLDLDADQDTSIRADTDDQIDIELGGTDHVKITTTAMFFDGVRLATVNDLRMPIDIAPRVDYRVEQIRSNAVLMAASFS